LNPCTKYTQSKIKRERKEKKSKKKERMNEIPENLLSFIEIIFGMRIQDIIIAF